ncbi:hypothetical protein [Desulfobacter sp.]|uniref:hypothetical protein n=1 Tax=Desulfobacter sp. TaxID=2294 RepID=UPI00257DB472|nr:hypothetical protein [Desulfobacter sp.]
MTHIDATTSRKIDLYLEKIYPDSKLAGDELAAKKLEKTQLRGLETVITSTSRFSEIINYIKNQAARDTNRKWIDVAPRLIRQLDALEAQAETLGNGDASLILDIKMKLARGWGKQVITHCLYELQRK